MEKIVWLMLNDAFFSLVAKDCARDELLVRARRKGDIEKVFPEAKVRRDDGTDYLYRAPIKRDVIAKAMAGEVARINYPNFKDSVTDDRLHNAYLRVWTAMASLQPGGLFGYADRFHREPVDIAPKSPISKKAPAKKRRRSLRRGA